jgi:hypothetical protein
MHRIFEEFPEIRRTLKDPYRSRVFHDILLEAMGAAVARSRPTLEECIAMVMDAGYHVTSQQKVVVPMRKPGVEIAPRADTVLGTINPGSQKARLLAQYALAGEAGLTDNEAAVAAGIPMTSMYWARCRELRQNGLITPMVAGDEDVPVSRIGSSGTSRVVCVVTPEGLAVAASLEY